MPNVLVVDDEMAVLAVLVRILSREGYEVRPAASGEEALALYEEATPDFIVTDLSMPGMHGMELLSIIRARPEGQSLPVIIASANITPQGRIAAQEFGNTYLLDKPFEVEDLLKLLSDLSSTLD